MKGTVWAGLMCTSTMDQLCKFILQQQHLLYKYRGKVSVPPLQMVDDVITAAKCGSTSSALNAAINTFMEVKKLQLGVDKCATVHIGNNISKERCSVKNVHGEDMKISIKEKYLGDFVTSNGNSKETICDRKIRGNAILAEIRAILKDIPLGNQRTQTGLVLRQAWFINACFVNSEVWSGYTDSDLKDLEVIDHDIL